MKYICYNTIIIHYTILLCCKGHAIRAILQGALRDHNNVGLSISMTMKYSIELDN